MNPTYHPPSRGWLQKFADALEGIRAGMRGQYSFYVHVPVAMAVLTLAWVLGVGLEKTCLLLLCIAAVLGAELMNSALERLAKAITSQYDEDVRVGLNIASGAVLLVSLAAALIGTLILLPPLLAKLQALAT